MSDIVERLRNTPNWKREEWQDWKECTLIYDRAPFEAADTIEQLRRERDEAVKCADSGITPAHLEAKKYCDQLTAANAEIARLKKAIVDIGTEDADEFNQHHDDMLNLVEAANKEASAATRRAEEAEREVKEQARLLGMGSEREARLLAKVKELAAERDDLIATQWVQGEQYAAATCVIERCREALKALQLSGSLDEDPETQYYHERRLCEALAAIDEYRTQSGHDRTQKEQGC